MKFLECKNCGSLLEQSTCKYCGTDSNSLILSRKEYEEFIEKIVKTYAHYRYSLNLLNINALQEHYYDHIYMGTYMGKKIFVNIGV